ncbi:MAG: hypothetical protein ACR2MB_04760 [Acidimicrobiales bacterium]
MSSIDDDQTAAPVPFEDVVAALLKVDPEGIIGQTKGKGTRKDEGDDPGA